MSKKLRSRMRSAAAAAGRYNKRMMAKHQKLFWHKPNDHIKGTSGSKLQHGLRGKPKPVAIAPGEAETSLNLDPTHTNKER